MAEAAVAWPWSVGTPSPAAQEGQGGLAAEGVQVRDALVSRSGTATGPGVITHKSKF